MTYILYFSIAVLLLLVGHFFRMLRWKQFIMIYEKPDSEVLLRSLVVGYAINFFIPFRIGDIIRAIISGKKLKNGVSFSLSTIIIEHFLDIPVVCCVFAVMAFLRHDNSLITNSAITYAILTGFLIILGALAIKFSGWFKSVAKAICSIFNHTIEHGLLFFLWSLITSFKNVFLRISKLKLIGYTVCMWAIYISSYFCLSEAILSRNVPVKFSDLFTTLFSQGGFSASSQQISFELFIPSDKYTFDLVAYIAISLVLLLLISLVITLVKGKNISETNSNIKTEKIINLLPWINKKDSLNFLEEYFSNGNSQQLKQYIYANKDIHIIQDFSAGSNATTMLCMNEEQTFYRKYALGKDGDKLYEQVLWLHEHENDLPLPLIINEQHSNGFCIYDMEYNAAAIGLFNYIHSTSKEKSWQILEQSLNCLKDNLHTKNLRPADKALTKKYIEDKVWGNIKKIETSNQIKPLLEYDKLIINGEEYTNFKHLKKWLAPEYLNKVFAEDNYADIHGDLTVENIVCFEANKDVPYYFIDPNTGNLHDSPALDYAKLLQSLHGSYEFLMRTEKVNVDHNQIIFISAGSKNYSDIYKKYDKYLRNTFTPKQVRSIYFHEVIHWLRLMPYKIEKDGARAVLFFAGLIKIFNDTVKDFTSEDFENQIKQ